MTKFLVWDARNCRRGWDLPGRMVAHRPAPGGSLTASSTTRPSTADFSDRYESRSSRATSGQYARPAPVGPSGICGRAAVAHLGRQPSEAPGLGDVRIGQLVEPAYSRVMASPAASPAASPISRRTTHQRSSRRATSLGVDVVGQTEPSIGSGDVRREAVVVAV